MVGLGMEKGRGRYRSGDFLIRHLMGMDRQNGVLAVGALLEEGQVVQFHVRDAESHAVTSRNSSSTRALTLLSRPRVP